MDNNVETAVSFLTGYSEGVSEICHSVFFHTLHVLIVCFMYLLSLYCVEI